MTTIALHTLLTLRPSLRIVHHVPGRLRVRLSVDALKRAAKLSLSEFRLLIEGLNGVQRLRLSSATLSAVIEYDAGVLAPALWDILIDGPEHTAKLAFEALTTSAYAAQEEVQ